MSRGVLGRERKIRERERPSPWAGGIRGMMLALVSLLLLALVWLVSTEIPTSPYVQGKTIFILAGQSNMAGRGGVVRGVWDGIVPTQCQPNPSILRLSAGLEWEGAHEPLHADIDRNKTCGVGPGMAFANALLEKSPGLGVVGLGLVPCAVGGTSISQWSRGTTLYNDLVTRAKAALQDGGSLEAILWYQGERDTVTQQDADAYQEKLEKFMVDVRSDLQSISVPIFQVGLASGEGAFVETVRQAQAQVCVDVANVTCVDAKGLSLEPDALHLTTPAQVLLGHMLADAYLHTLVGLGPPGPIQGPLLSHALATSSYLISNFFILPIPIFIAFLLS